MKYVDAFNRKAAAVLGLPLEEVEQFLSESDKATLELAIRNERTKEKYRPWVNMDGVLNDL